MAKCCVMEDKEISVSKQDIQLRFGAEIGKSWQNTNAINLKSINKKTFEKTIEKFYCLGNQSVKKSYKGGEEEGVNYNHRSETLGAGGMIQFGGIFK